MKKIAVSMCMAGVALVLALSSCRSTKDIPSLSSINGEWNIIEINGISVSPTNVQKAPFIGFETATGNVYGNSGCNRMMGSFDVNDKPGNLDLSKMGSTRMMCPDMTLEQNVLGALTQVKGYKQMGKGHIALCNGAKRPVLILQKKAADVQLSALNGAWLITKVNSEAVLSEMDTTPFLQFAIGNKSSHSNAGCNIVNGGFKTDDNNVRSISFPALATTMMACPAMDVESKILKAMNEVASFDQLANGGIELYDANGTVVLVLAQK